MRKISFGTGEYYHVFNRGVDKRSVFMDANDSERFVQSIIEFNDVCSIGSLYEANKKRNSVGSLAPNTPNKEKLVDIVAYCLNPNHYHLILLQRMEGGISKFMQKVSTGYTNYFNERYKRSGSLFQGPFKAVHITSNELLLYESVYVNLNYRVHRGLEKGSHETLRTSWQEYVSRAYVGLCKKDAVLGQFKNRLGYEKFAQQTIVGIVEKRKMKEGGDVWELNSHGLGV